ncbi:MAG TPA: sodium/proline symporter [Myxococcota bacterium]
MVSAEILAVLAVYAVVLVSIGIWGGRESGSVAGYYVAGKKLPSWVIAFSSNATGESAWLLLGLTGMGYMVGIHALWVVLGEVLGVALVWVLVGLRFKEYTDRYDSITVADYLESRFRDEQRILRLLSVVIIFSMVTAYAAAQLTASGKALSSFLGMSYEMGVVIGIALILFYTTVGGFTAVAYNDLLHGILMFLGLLSLPIVGIVAAGGWSPMLAELGAIDPDLLKPMGEYGVSVTGVVSAVSFVGIGVAFLGAPQLLTRFISARDRSEIVDGSMMAVAVIIVFDLGAVFAGMAGRVLFPGLADAETILPTMSAELMPAICTGVFLVIVLAAILSTVDSLLILASSAVVRDLVQKMFHPNLSERHFSLLGRLTTVVIGAIALALALQEMRVIFWFVLFAWSGLAVAFAPVVLCSLFWSGTTKAGAVAGMVSGFVTTVLWVLFFKEHFYSLYEMLPGFAVGFVVTVGVSLVTRPPEGAEAELESVRRAVE